MRSYRPNTEDFKALVAELKLHLPNSLPLLYRLQSSQGSEALIYDSRSSLQDVKQEMVFTLAVVDRSQWPMTEAWVFCSAEKFLHDKRNTPISKELPDDIDAIKEKSRQQLHALLVAIRQNGTNKRTKDGNIPALLMGSVPDCLADLICPRAYQTRSVTSPYEILPLPTWRKYFISLPCRSQKVREVDMTNLVFCPLRPEHIPLVQANSPYPRERETLIKLQSMAAYPTDVLDGKPVAWAYLSLDGSLQSLHVEPSQRRRGLGQHIVSVLLNTQALGSALAHADVASDNIGSVRIFENLGGSWTYHIHWIHLDLTALQDDMQHV